MFQPTLENLISELEYHRLLSIFSAVSTVNSTYLYASGLSYSSANLLTIIIRHSGRTSRINQLSQLYHKCKPITIFIRQKGLRPILFVAHDSSCYILERAQTAYCCYAAVIDGLQTIIPAPEQKSSRAGIMLLKAK